VQGVERLGKRIVFDFGDDCFLLLHLMIHAPAALVSGRVEGAGQGLAGRAGVRPRRAARHRNVEPETGALHLVRGPDALRAFDRAGWR
jgi:hypothetical protein